MGFNPDRPAKLILQNGDVIEYDTLRALAYNIDKHAKLLHWYAVNDRYVAPNSGLFVKVAYNDGLPAEDEPKPERKRKLVVGTEETKRPPHSKWVRVTDKNGDSLTYQSIAEAARTIGVHASTIKAAAIRGGRSRGLKIEITDEEPVL